MSWWSRGRVPAEDPDDKCLRQALEEVAEARYLVAHRLLQQVQDKSKMTAQHRHIADLAEYTRKALDEVSVPFAEDGTGEWKKQTELGSQDRPTVVYYKVRPDHSMTLRIEAAIEESLVNPVLAVFNETDLYTTWMPSWQNPKLGVEISEKCAEMGRGNQLVHLAASLLFPFSSREVYLHAFATDSIEEDKAVVVCSRSVPAGTEYGDFTVPPVPAKGVVRADMDLVILIKPLPSNHPAYQQQQQQLQQQRGDGTASLDSVPESTTTTGSSSRRLNRRRFFRRRRKKKNNNNDTDADDDDASQKPRRRSDETLVMIQILQTIDGHVQGVPLSWINFVARTAIGLMFVQLLQVAEQIRDGKRPAHQQAMDRQAELYGWVHEKIQRLFEVHRAEEQQQQQHATTTTKPNTRGQQR